LAIGLMPKHKKTKGFRLFLFLKLGYLLSIRSLALLAPNYLIFGEV
jgi:hypothetical protein